MRLAAALRRGGGWLELGPLETAVRSCALLPQLVSMQLFDGATKFVHDEGWSDEGDIQQQRSARPMQLLRRLVAGRGAAAEALVHLRGKQVHFASSQLELACDVDCCGDGGGSRMMPE